MTPVRGVVIKGSMDRKNGIYTEKMQRRAWPAKEKTKGDARYRFTDADKQNMTRNIH